MSLQRRVQKIVHLIALKNEKKNEQRSRDAAVKKRANTSGIGKINNYCEDIGTRL